MKKYLGMGMLLSLALLVFGTLGVVFGWRALVAATAVAVILTAWLVVALNLIEEE